MVGNKPAAEALQTKGNGPEKPMNDSCPRDTSSAQNTAGVQDHVVHEAENGNETRKTTMGKHQSVNKVSAQSVTADNKCRLYVY